MSKGEFLENLRTARNVFFHGVGPRAAQKDPRDPAAQLARATIWLAPSTVSGFKPSLFSELPPDDRERLTKDVEEFLNVARHVGQNGQPTDEDVRRALQPFVEIVRILDPYLSADKEAERVREILEGVDFPPGIVTWEYKVGNDSTGDPAVWIWLFVDEDLVRRKEVGPVSTAARERIFEAFAAAGSPRWPYVRVRTTAEQRDLATLSR